MYVGYLQYSLVLFLLGFLAAEKFVPGQKYKIFSGATMLALGFVSISDNYILGYFLGFFGQLSVITTTLLIAWTLKSFIGYSLLNESEKKHLLYSVVIFGTFFYPMTLGLSMFDPYRYGFQSDLLVSVLLLASIPLWLYGYRFMAVCILVASISNHLNLLESDNYWDYLIDIYLYIGGLIYFLAYVYRNKLKSKLLHEPAEN